MVTVGSSVPARRPFYKPHAAVPALIKKASDFASDPIYPIYAYTLTGGWPTVNSLIRMLASALAVLSAFSFAAVASLVSPRIARRIFSTSMLVLAVTALAAAILDVIAISRASIECANKQCTTAVPEAVLASRNTCDCSVEGWFVITLFADVVLVFCSLVCGLLTIHPKLAAAVTSGGRVVIVEPFTPPPPQPQLSPSSSA